MVVETSVCSLMLSRVVVGTSVIVVTVPLVVVPSLMVVDGNGIVVVRLVALFVVEIVGETVVTSTVDSQPDPSPL